MLAQIISAQHSHLWWITAGVIAVIALYVFIKIEHFLLRLLMGFVGLAAVAFIGWWFFLRH